jgi:cysteine-rich repeat protein
MRGPDASATRRRPAGSRCVVLLASAMVVAPAFASLAVARLVAGQGSRKFECYVGVNYTDNPVLAPDVSDDGHAILQACGGMCRFDLSLCTNVWTPHCSYRPVKRIIVVGDLGEHDGKTNPPLGRPNLKTKDRDNPHCPANFTQIFVPAGQSRTVKVYGLAKGRTHRDVDVLTLDCQPSNRACCGDRIKQPDEECDGDADCDPNCRTHRCGNGYTTPPEECDDSNDVDGDTCNSDCTLPHCGDGTVNPDRDEECEPSRLPNGCSAERPVCRSDCKCAPPRQACRCKRPGGAVLPDRSTLQFQWTDNAEQCGELRNDAGDPIRDRKLACDTLYAGAGDLGSLGDPTAAVPIVGRGMMTFDVDCDGTEVRLGPMQGGEGCTAPGCLFGSPIAFGTPLNRGVCLLMYLPPGPSSPVHGNIQECGTGAVDVTMPLNVEVFLGVDDPNVEPERACPICDGSTQSSCARPSTPIATLLIRDVSFGTSQVEWLARTLGSATMPLPGAFCGYCSRPRGGFEGDPDEGGFGAWHACERIEDCTTEPFTSCDQEQQGAFSSVPARTIELDAHLDGNLLDGQSHPATLAGYFCVPPTFASIDGTSLDDRTSLPGPGAIVLDGSLLLGPAPTSAPTSSR